MTKHTYYMTQRPFSIGAQPKEGLVEVEDFDGKKRVKATSKVRVRGFKRNEVSREFFEAHM